MTLLEDQVLVASQAQETRDLMHQSRLNDSVDAVSHRLERRTQRVVEFLP
jgi:hypothetical protein